MIDPNTAALYRYAEEHQPMLYEHLCLVDRELAHLHEAGMVIQRQRRALLDDLRKFAQSPYRIEPISLGEEDATR